MPTVTWDTEDFPRVDGESEWAVRWCVRARSIDEPLRDLVTKQGFVATPDQLRDIGISAAAVRRELYHRRWHIPHRGVVAPLPLEDETGAVLRATAHTLTRPGHVISHRSAATLQEMPLVDLPGRAPLVTELTLPGRHRPRTLTGTRVRTARLCDREVSRWYGAPVTSPARTVVDLARVDRQWGIVAADAALRSERVTLSELKAQAQACLRMPGGTQAAAVVALGSAGSESPLESLARLLLLDAGIPAPTLQYRIDLPGSRAFVDMCWPEHKVVLELDRRVKYVGSVTDAALTNPAKDAGWREKKRAQALSWLGWTVLRLIWAEVVYDPAGSIAQVRRVLHLA